MDKRMFAEADRKGDGTVNLYEYTIFMLKVPHSTTSFSLVSTDSLPFAGLLIAPHQTPQGIHSRTLHPKAPDLAIWQPSFGHIHQQLASPHYLCAFYSPTVSFLHVRATSTFGVNAGRWDRLWNK